MKCHLQFMRFKKETALAAARYTVCEVNGQPRFSDGRFAPYENERIAASIAVNSGVVFG